MSPEKWLRLEELFEQGSGQPLSRQKEILAKCSNDPEIQAELELLWEHENASEGFLAAPQQFEVSEPQESLQPNRSIAGRFNILEKIGHGGMGEVYRALDQRLQRIVAIKVISSKLSTDASYRSRLEQEARAVSSLSHPGICALHDLSSDGSLLFFVMEYVEGQPLDVRLKAGSIAEKEAVSIALAICSALQHAHSKGLVHRDLKPANVMLTSQGVKLLDFGIACRTGTSDPSRHIVGTPAYMSPEQASGQPVDSTSDIYSLGVLLSNMLPPNPSARLRSIVDRCLNPVPAKRFSSAAELARALQRRSASPLLRSAVVLAVSVLAIGILAYLFRQKTPHSAEPDLRVLTSYPGTEYFPTFAPDGNSFAFLWNGQEDNYDIYIRSFNSDPPRRLTTNPLPESSPRWSPDGKSIAFVRDGNAMLISPLTRIEQFVIKIDPTSRIGCDVSLAWSADSKRLIFPKQPSPGHPALLHDIDIATGRVRQLTDHRTGSAGQSCPELSPDGTKLLFQSVELGQPKVLLAKLDSQGNCLSVQELSWIDGWSHAWTPDNKDFIYSRNLPGATFLFRGSANQSEAPRLLPYGEEGMYPTISKRSGRLIYMRRRLDIHIWQASITPSASPSSLQPQKILASSQPDNFPEYSPDGSRIAFISNRGGKSELWISDSKGHHLYRLAEADAFIAPPRWAPDGNSLVYSFKADIYRISAVENSHPQTLIKGPAVENAPSYSRDGRWIYFTSHQNGTADIWRMPAAGGKAVQVTTVGAYLALESSSGKQLLLLRKQNAKEFLYTTPVSGGKMQLISRVPIRPTLWVSPHGFYFIAATASDDFPYLSYCDEASGRVRAIARIPHRQRSLATGLTATPDEKQFLYATYDLQADLMLVENYR